MGKTSWQAKRKYNNKTYSRLVVELDKDLVADFKEKCRAEGVTQAGIIRKAIQDFLESENDKNEK